MKQKILIFVITFVVVSVLTYGGYWIFYDTMNAPKGELVAESESPNGEYIIKAYVKGGGSTTDFTIVGQLNFNKRNKKSKEIYFHYHENTAEINWSDNDTVIINGHELNVPNDTLIIN